MKRALFDNKEGGMLIQHLPWDSDFFGFRIGCYTKHMLSDDDEKVFLKEFDDQRYDCVYIFSDSHDEGTKQIAMRNQFLFVDERLIYYLPDNYQKHNISGGSYCLLDYSNKCAVERARSIIDKISSVSRFTHDPRLCDKAKRMYAIWFDQIMGDPSGALVIIPEKQSNLPAAIVGCSVGDSVGELVLVGVDSRFRGQGLGVAVAKSAIGWLYEHGAKRIKVKTQASAEGAASLYEKIGFVLEESKAIYHVWRGGPFIVFGKPTLGEEEIQAVTEVLKSGWIGMGPRCIEFEKLFAEYVGSPFAVSVSSCTAALHLALAALDIGPGDEVITTPFTFVATISAIEYVGAKPVLVDIDPQTLNINPVLVERAVTSRTKAILPVHFGGLPCAMNYLQAIARKYGLSIVEDAAHAVGARLWGTMIGGMPGSIACFSFYPNKNITTIEGGMITTDSEELARTLQIMRLHGLDNEAWRRYSQGTRLTFSEAVMRGFKYNMTDVSAALGICQLRKLEDFLAARERYAGIYNQHFTGLPCAIQHQQASAHAGNRHALHLYALVLDISALDTTRDRIVQEIRDQGIGAAVHYRAVHMHPYFQRLGYLRGSLPESERVSESILTLPLTPSMSEKEAEYVASATRKIIVRHLRM